MVGCPSDDEILTFAAGAASPELHAAILRHMDGCASCRVVVAESIRGAAAGERTPAPQGGSADSSAAFQVARYEIRRLLGAGGAGMVYEAFDPQLSRRVAVKLVQPSAGPIASAGVDPDRDARRLLREARAMAQLSHPNVVTVFDAGSFEERVFIAMELVEGQTLAAFIAERRPDWRTVTELFCAAGRGLCAAHAAGLVHGDFKPENVLVGGDGRPRVTDFGLARPMRVSQGERAELDAAPLPTETLRKLRSTLLTLTEAGVLSGTPAYMAPEQFQGRHADTLTDQFNFCASLWSALYGQAPFAPNHSERGALFSLARAVFEGQLRAPPADSPVPETVRRIVARGLARDRGARFSSMDALLAALEAEVTPRVHDAPRPAATRSPLTWVAAAAVLVLMGGGAALALRRDERPSEASGRAPAELPGPAPRASAEAASPASVEEAAPASPPESAPESSATAFAGATEPRAAASSSASRADPGSARRRPRGTAARQAGLAGSRDTAARSARLAPATAARARVSGSAEPAIPAATTATARQPLGDGLRDPYARP